MPLKILSRTPVFVLMSLLTTALYAQQAQSPQAYSCAELYQLASSLEPGTQRFRSPLFNEKTNVLATAIGSVTNIGYYYFGFSITRDYYEDYRNHQRLQELDQVRRQMASQYCFIKS